MANKITRFVRSHSLAVLLLALAIPLALPFAASATPDPHLIGGNAVTGYSGTAMPITDVQLSGTGNPTVPVKLRVTSGTLAMTTTTGLTFTGSSSGATLQFSGSLSNVNSALATLRYTRTGTGSDTLEASLVNPGEVFFPGNGHLYEYVTYTGTWNQAKTAAEGRTKYSASGYLATITSQAENDFVSARLLDAGWMGASDSVTEGNWKWVTGPENGTQFWQGAGGGSAVNSQYANWNTNEPNDSGGNEDCAQFLSGASGKWNDLPCTGTTLPGYVAEYGSNASPIDISSLNVSITTLAANQYPNTPTSLGGTDVVNGAWRSNIQPPMSFSLSDSDGSDTVQYRIQVDDSADFSSPVVDYTSSIRTQGSASFVVGQSVGSGNYTVGSYGQTLDDGSYYWRVKTIDNHGAESAYATARSGAVAFKIDTTSPTAPGQPHTSASPTTNTQPSFSWIASSDSGAGLDSTAAYTVNWSTHANMSSPTSATTNTPSFTVPGNQALSDGTWYFQITTTDAVGNTAQSAVDAVVIDTTSPTIPQSLIITSPPSVTTPSLSWAASTDGGSGLGNPAYTIEWSPLADFSSAVGSGSSNTTTFTVPTGLNDGTWYFRVLATDALGNDSLYASSASVAIDTYVPPAPVNPPADTTAATQTTHKTSDTGTTDREPAATTASQPANVSQETPAPAGTDQGAIVLNNFSEYTEGQGKQLALQAGQVIYFYLGLERHSATVKEVHPEYVIVTIASTPHDVRIERGDSVGHDVDGDGKDDIILSFSGLDSAVQNSAAILFKLPRPAANPATAAATAQPAKATHGAWWIVVLLILVVAWLFAAIMRRRKHQHASN